MIENNVQDQPYIELPLMQIKTISLVIALALFSSICQAQTRLITEIIEPFQMMDNERLTGSNVEYLRGIYRKAKIPFPDIEVYPWVRGYDIVKNTPNTMLFAMVRTQWREPDFIWVGHMATTRYYLYKLKGNDKVRVANIQDVRKFVLAVVKEAFAHEYFVSKGFISRRKLPDSFRLRDHRKTVF